MADLRPTWPGVTCSLQATLTTGVGPEVHGVIGNGFATYRSRADADLTDPANLTDYRRKVSFWEQSNQWLETPRVWAGKGRKTALLFFQNCMPGFTGTPSPAADVVLTPKPEHGEGGKLTSLLWSNPADLATRLQRDLGPFPLMNYWGPMAGLKSSQWIAVAAAKVWTDERPDLQLTYVPHLDYDLQRFGPHSPQAAVAVADLANALDPLLAVAEADGAGVIIVGEYGIAPVERAIAPNRALRDAGLLKLTHNAEGPAIDYAASDAWVMCDHQIGHVYTRSNTDLALVREVLMSVGVEPILPKPVPHPRAGDLQVQAPTDAWLDYRWWPEDAPPAEVPTWARTVDIHRKPGYDPLELFFDPATRSIITDAARIKGSHGRTDGSPGVVIAPASALSGRDRLTATEFAGLL